MTREQAHVFGPQRNLYGVLAQPEGPVDPARPAVLLLSIGLMHHVGACRAWVTLARRLAALGYASLRFDMGGIGDSDAGERRGSDVDCAVAEMRAAMDFVSARTGARRFILVGLCASADTAHPAALADERVVGLAVMDAFGYRTSGWYRRHYLPRLLNPRSWRNFLHRKLKTRGPGFVRDFPPREQAERELQQLVDRGVRLLFLYTSGVPQYFNAAEQFAEMFPGLDPRGRIDVELDPLSTHIYQFRGDRERMLANIAAWVSARDWG